MAVDVLVDVRLPSRHDLRLLLQLPRVLRPADPPPASCAPSQRDRGDAVPHSQRASRRGQVCLERPRACPVEAPPSSALPPHHPGIRRPVGLQLRHPVRGAVDVLQLVEGAVRAVGGDQRAALYCLLVGRADRRAGWRTFDGLPLPTTRAAAPGVPRHADVLWHRAVLGRGVDVRVDSSMWAALDGCRCRGGHHDVWVAAGRHAL
ncbi:putative efflux pump antibiotic resistance protein [Colletotrichum asianum]